MKRRRIRAAVLSVAVGLLATCGCKEEVKSDKTGPAAAKSRPAGPGSAASRSAPSGESELNRLPLPREVPADYVPPPPVPKDPKRAADRWKPWPKDMLCYTLYSPDGRLLVDTVVDKRHEGTLWASSQVRFRCKDPDVKPYVASWGHDGPGSATYPRFTRIFKVADDAYLVLGWIAPATNEIILYAWLAKIEGGRIRFGMIEWRGRADQLRMVYWPVYPPLLGLFAVNGTKEAGMSAMGQEALIEDLSRWAKAPARLGCWYTRGGRIHLEPPPGRIHWINLIEALKRVGRSRKPAE